MLRWLARRIIAAALVVFVVTSLVFVVTHVFTDPATVSLPLEASEEQRDQRRAALGLDRSIGVQYWDFVSGLVVGDFGESFWQSQPASKLVLERLPATLRLVAGATVVTVLMAAPLGMLAAWLERRFADHAIMGLSMAAISAPPFWIGYLLIIVFAVQLGWVPTFGSSGWRSLILPSFAVGLASAGRLTQMTRRGIVEELRKPYAVTAMSRGFSRSYTIVHHTFRNIATSFVTMTGWELTRMFTGYTVVIEVVFSWPGVGRLAVQAIDNRDLILVQAAVVVLATLVVVTNLLVDVARRLIDPRVELL
ncbi:MAG: ABC transporter permease [Acidimicrobiaceae bacterium]|nr:ABC transporter permease [Acidimicrobiaceae bacterium]MCY4280310.1 ABC transporter permease [Acidimicrobiaceae bacterium]MCY4293972.1 ABC transporter permease [Acidimicrobiaceae bacterium]